MTRAQPETFLSTVHSDPNKRESSSTSFLGSFAAVFDSQLISFGNPNGEIVESFHISRNSVRSYAF